MARAASRPLGQALTVDTLGGILFGAESGRVWRVRLALAAVLEALLLLRGHEQEDRDRLALRDEAPGPHLRGRRGPREP